MIVTQSNAEPLGAYPGHCVIPEVKQQGLEHIYLANKVNDLGRPVVQHKPLYKGDHTQALISKVFDDPTMRPRVFAPPTVNNKQQTSLITGDIDGAQPQLTGVWRNPRGTNPLHPEYHLPARSVRPQSAAPILRSSTSMPPWAANSPHASPSATSSGETASAGGAGPAAPAGGAELGGFGSGGGWVPYQEPAPQQHASSSAPARDPNSISDIEGSRPHQFRSEFSTKPPSTLRHGDMEGDAPGWKPHFRQHVGVNLRDPGLNVADINKYRQSKIKAIIAKAEAAAKEQRQQAAEGGGAASGSSSRSARPVSAPASRPKPQQATGYGGLPEGFEYTGLPLFQAPPEVLQAEKQAAAAAVAAPGHQDDAVELSWQVAKEMNDINATMQWARKERRLLRTAPAHEARVSVAESQDAARAAANQAISELTLSRQHTERLWDAMRRLDREGCGKLTAVEFGRAFDDAGVQVSPQQLRSMVKGLRDGVGLLGYRDLAKTLLVQSKHHSSSASPYSPSYASATKPPKQRPQSAHPGSASPQQQPAGGQQLNRQASGGAQQAAAQPAPSQPSRPWSAAPATSQQPPKGPSVSWAPQVAANAPSSSAAPGPSPSGGAQWQPAPSHQYNNPYASPVPYQPISPEQFVAQSQAYAPIAAPPVPQGWASPAQGQGQGWAAPAQGGQREHSASGAREPQRPAAPTAQHSEAAAASAEPSAPGAPGKAAENNVKGVKVGDSTYFPFKSDAYWFGGNGSSEEKSQEAAAWKAGGDLSHMVTQYHVGLGDANDLADPGQAPSRPPGYVTKMDQDVRDEPTISSALKSGMIDREQLAKTEGKGKVVVGAGPPSGTYPMRPKSASLLARTLSGQLTGPPPGGLSYSTKSAQPSPGPPTVPGAGASSARLGRPASANARVTAAAGRPSSATAAAGFAGATAAGGARGLGSFSSMNNATRLQHQMLREDIAAVRSLY